MGNRAIFLVTNASGKRSPAAVYVHWCESQAIQMAEKLAERMAGRDGDVAYATARLCGLWHEMLDGNLSLGVIAAPKTWSPEALKRFSHGDAGVIVINCSDWTARAYGGYLDREGDAPYVLRKPAVVTA